MKRGTCRVCGCTDARACTGGCSWVEPDLCSACADRARYDTLVAAPHALTKRERAELRRLRPGRSRP